MKKIFALAIALVMVLALAAPAMAFTSKAIADDEPYELDIYLVEYEDNDFFGIISLPESDRGYAKNEIVAAVAELYVPEKANLSTDGYTAVEFSGENVKLTVADNDWTKVPVVGLTTATEAFNLATGETNVYVRAAGVTGLDDDATYKWLFYAKVTDDDASITFALRTAGLDFDEETTTAVKLNDDYEVFYSVEDGDGEFEVSENGGVELFTIIVDEDFESIGLRICYDNVEYTVADGRNGLLFFHNGNIEDDEDIIDELMEIYEEVFVEEFGFDFDLLGGVVDFDTFLDYAGSDDIEVTVDIAPWTAYVTVPDNIVVDPPKTGDAASILGFVMIVLAAAAVVAVRKVRA